MTVQHAETAPTTGTDDALLGALAVGGTPAALTLCRQLAPEAGEAAALEHLLQVFFAVADGPSEVSAAVAERLVVRHGLAVAPAALFDVLRADILIHQGPLEEITEAILAAMRHQRWALALHGLERLRTELGDRCPRNAYGLASVCLHRLGEYARADQWVRDGLGVQQDLLTLPELFTEAQLLQRWGGRTEPVVSIICLTYNHERYVQSALHGFLSQDLSEPFEVLIHDDASTDRTAAIIRQWQARYPSIIKPVLQQENQYSRGGRPFETMLGRARGEFVASCEGDDFWVHPRKLQRQVDMLRRHPDLSSCAHNYYHFQESSLKIKPWSTIGSDFFLTPRQLMQIATLLWMPTLMFRRRFSAFPPERRLASLGDAFLTSYLGTFGPAAYLETLYGAVRRENEFSLWSPLPQARKQEWCIRTWTALRLMHERLGNAQAVDDLREKIERFPMAAATKRTIADDVLRAAGRLPVEACHG